MKAIKTQAIITSFRSKVDRSLSFSVQTPELTTTERATFMDLQGLNVEMLIDPKDEKFEGTVTIDKEVVTKTPSQRLRAVMFLTWQKNGSNGDFQAFYQTEMERLIDSYKRQLEGLE